MPVDDEAAVPPTKRSLPVSRRDLIAGAAGALGASLLPGVSLGGAEVQESQVPPPAAPGDRAPGRLPSELGSRAPGETPKRDPSLTSSRTPLQDLHGAVTPSDLHFERHHAGIPEVDPEEYSLLIHGMVERPTVFTLADIKRLPSTSRICFLECSGNFPTGAGPETLAQNVCGLTSQSEWTGVPLARLFQEVGVHPQASWFLAEGQDGAAMARSIPLEKGLDDALIVYGQNGEALRPEQGYPVRLLLPGWEGNTNVKWLRRIELSDAPWMTREETSRYTDPLKNGMMRQFSWVIDARSIITTPSFPARIEPGWHEIRGIAWSGRGRIERVEVSVDGGRNWILSDLQGPALAKAHTRFRLMWEWDGRRTEILSRATDDTGYVQPTRAELIEARGAGTAYHLNPVTAWVVEEDGRVFFREEPWG